MRHTSPTHALAQYAVLPKGLQLFFYLGIGTKTIVGSGPAALQLTTHDPLDGSNYVTTGKNKVLNPYAEIAKGSKVTLYSRDGVHKKHLESKSTEGTLSQTHTFGDCFRDLGV